MIHIINNCFSTDYELQQEVVKALFPNAESYNIPEITLDYFLFFKYGVYPEKEKHEIVRSYFNLNFMENYKTTDYVFLHMFDEHVIPYINSYIGVKYVKFYNVVRNAKEFFQYFNPNFYSYNDDKGKYDGHSIYGFFEMMNNGLHLIDVNGIDTIYFNDMKVKFNAKEYKVNDLSLYNKYKSNFSEQKWKQVVVDEKSILEVFGENV